MAKYLIKAIADEGYGSNWSFKNAEGRQAKFFGRERFRVVAHKDQVGNFVTGLTKDDEKAYEKLLKKGTGYLSAAGKFWQDSPCSWMEEDHKGFFIDHFVNVDPRTGDDAGSIIETGTETPELILNEIKVKLMRVSPFVALNGERKSGAIISLTSLEEVAAKKTQNRKQKAKAYSILESLTPAEQRKYYTIIFMKKHKDLTDNGIYEKISDFVETKPETFIALASDISVMEKYKYTLLHAHGIIVKVGSEYVFEGERLGVTLDDIYNLLREPASQGLKHRIEQAYIKIEN